MPAPAKYSMPDRYIPKEEEKTLLGVILPGTIYMKTSIYGHHYHRGAQQNILISANSIRFHHNLVGDDKVWVRHHYPSVFVECFRSSLPDNKNIWFPSDPVKIIERRLWFTTKPVNRELLAYGIPMIGYLTHSYSTTIKKTGE